jgi:hypothetical protein
VVNMSPQLPGCWLTLGDARNGVNYWGVLEELLPKPMVRWWEVSDEDGAGFVHAFSANGKKRWSLDLELGVARMREELGVKDSIRAFVPDDWGELDGGTGTGLSEDWNDDLAELFGKKKKKKRKVKVEKDPHAAWYERDDRTMLDAPQKIVAAAPADLRHGTDLFDYAEALWRMGRRDDAKIVLAKWGSFYEATNQKYWNGILDAAAPAIWIQPRKRYLPDFSLAVLDALPSAIKGVARYWLHRIQALARLQSPEVVPLLRKRFAKGELIGDIELKEALQSMPRGPQRTEGLKLFAEAELEHLAAVERAEQSRRK